MSSRFSRHSAHTHHSSQLLSTEFQGFAHVSALSLSALKDRGPTHLQAEGCWQTD